MLLPTFSKLYSNTIVQQQWTCARDEIADADELWFVGYSFPPSDSYMRFFLADALSQNVKLKSLKIIDPMAIDIRSRMTSFFSNPTWCDYFEAVPEIWRD